MKSTVIALSSLLLVSACAVEPKSNSERNTYLIDNRIEFASVFPESVAVLTAPPACHFMDLGIASVHAPELEPSSSTIKALQQQAAMHGADAIILHKNTPADCAMPGDFALCPGKGEFNFATAIRYE